MTKDHGPNSTLPRPTTEADITFGNDEAQRVGVKPYINQAVSTTAMRRAESVLADVVQVTVSAYRPTSQSVDEVARRKAMGRTALLTGVMPRPTVGFFSLALAFLLCACSTTEPDIGADGAGNGHAMGGTLRLHLPLQP